MTEHNDRREFYHNQAAQNPQKYFVRDFGLAAALIIYDFAVEGFDVHEPRKVQVLFAKTPELLETVRKYWNNELMVPSLDHWNIIRSIKQQALNQL